MKRFGDGHSFMTIPGKDVTAERVVDWGQIYGYVDPLSPKMKALSPTGHMVSLISRPVLYLQHQI
jgi:hypothetical protein